MKLHQIMEYMLLNSGEFPEVQAPACKQFEIIVNTKEKNVRKKNNAEPLAHEKVYTFYKQNGGNFFDLVE